MATRPPAARYTAGVQPEELSRSVVVGGVQLVAVLGDLTREAVDVVVNAANRRLQHGGGLAGAIVARGGREIQTASDRLAPVAVGSAVVTTAGALPSRWIVHAVGPRWGEGDEDQLLRSAVRSSLARATELEARTISMPAISTGIFGYPKREGTAAIVDEVVGWLSKNPGHGITVVRFTAFDQETADLFAEAVRSLA
jgi:O-acetyl-ADP-ribose deacetylase (regulator of RNase III)